MDKNCTLVESVATGISIEEVLSKNTNDTTNERITDTSDGKTRVYNHSNKTFLVEQKWGGIPISQSVLPPTNYVIFDNYAVWYDYYFLYDGGKNFTKTMVKYGSTIVINPSDVR